MKIKDDFHHLIDAIEDEQLLSEEQKQELLLSYVSYEDSFDENHLVRHEQVKEQHSRWLKL